MLNIFYSVNASLYLTSGRTGLLIDGLYDGRSEGFSSMPEGTLAAIETRAGMFEQLDGLLFTHLHDDHYDQAAVQKVLVQRPELALWGPELECRGIAGEQPIPGGTAFVIGDFRIFAYVSEHSGKVFQDTPHRSFLIRNEATGEQIFIGGDAIFSRELGDYIMKETGGPGAIDATFLMVYQLAEQPSLDFLTRLAPKRLLLYHRPWEEDDLYLYLQIIRGVLRKNPLPGRTIEQPGHMQWIRMK